MTQTRPTDKTSGRPSNVAEHILEQGIFQSRWLLAPVYVGLALSLALILIKFGQESWGMAHMLYSLALTTPFSAFCRSLIFRLWATCCS